MALEDKWVAPLVMTHNVMACPLQWAKPISLSQREMENKELEAHKQSIQGCTKLRGCDVPMFFGDFHYVSFYSNSFSIGP